MINRSLAILLSLLLLTACAAGGQAPAPETSRAPESPSLVSEPAPEVSSSEPSSAPEESSQPEKEPVPAPEPPEGMNPDVGGGGPQENPDTSTMDPAAPDFGDKTYSDVFEQRAEPLRKALLPALEAIEEDYSYFSVWVADGSLDVVLEIGVIHEEKVDQFLAGWTGPSWDQVEKKPGRWPVAAPKDFAAQAAKLDLGPGVNIRTQTAVGSPEVVSVNVWLDDAYASQEEVNRWAQLPQAVKELAEKMGAPEDLIEYMGPRYTAPGNNPDT